MQGARDQLIGHMLAAHSQLKGGGGEAGSSHTVKGSAAAGTLQATHADSQRGGIDRRILAYEQLIYDTGKGVYA